LKSISDQQNMMNILILGSGGREHAIAWKVAQSQRCKKLFVAPGNAGTAQIAQNVNLDLSDFSQVGTFAETENIKLIVVGPEAPLVNGIADFFANNRNYDDIIIIGPTKAGAMLEGSKDFAKQFMTKFNIPTAQYKSFTKGQFSEGCDFLSTLKPPYVLKADGLAAGKGVVILDDRKQAQETLKQMIEGVAFGEAGKKVVIEEFLSGVELSVFVLTDGKNYLLLPEAKDYKRIGEGDTGKNTGGMGSVSPVPFATPAFMEKIEKKIIQPTINGLIAEGILYRGFIFFGLINVDGDPYVIEYNCRLGDPESEAVIPRIKTDMVALFEALNNQTLHQYNMKIEKQHAASVFLVSGGYPDDYVKGKVISNLEDVQGSLVYHAGTKQENGKILTDGGRVLAVTTLADDIWLALEKSYQNAQIIQFDGKYFRPDLGKDLKL
jgi:phosphoribosylamine---glycine ligase